MWIMAGLGNPGREYEKTRHNIGFMVMDAMAVAMGAPWREGKYSALTAGGYIGGERVLLVKPQTYMNRSGESLRQLIDYYKEDAGQRLIVVCDEISLPPGALRLRLSGSAGGHNGLKSLIQHLGRQDFARLRMGVGEKPPQYDLADYVLGRFAKEEEALVEQAVDDAVQALEMCVLQGPQKAMNRWNTPKKKKEEEPPAGGEMRPDGRQ